MPAQAGVTPTQSKGHHRSPHPAFHPSWSPWPQLGPGLLRARDQERRGDGKPKDIVPAAEAEPVQQGAKKDRKRRTGQDLWEPQLEKGPIFLHSEGFPEEFLPFPESLHCRGCGTSEMGQELLVYFKDPAEPSPVLPRGLILSSRSQAAAAVRGSESGLHSLVSQLPQAPAAGAGHLVPRAPRTWLSPLCPCYHW